MSLVSLRSALAERAARGFDALAGRVDVVAARAHLGPSLARRAEVVERRAHSSEELDPFAAPELPSLRLSAVSSIRSTVEVWDARWGRGAPNARAAARLFLHRTPSRSAVLLVHGYLGGHPATERWLWPVHRLLRDGHDVALVTLPEHGVRAPAVGSPHYPSRDPMATIRATRQSISELRQLLQFFRMRGARVGAAGASLGGYVVSLLATVETDLSFAIPVVPLSDLTAFAAGHVPDAECRTEMLGKAPELVRAYDEVSPLTRRPVVDRGRMVVLGARGDRIAPLAHAQELSRHFDCPLEVFSGGHWLQPSHGRLLRAIDRLRRTSSRDTVRSVSSPFVREVASTSPLFESCPTRFS